MSESLLAWLREMIARPPLHQWLKPQVAEVDEASGRVVVALPLRPEFRRDPERPEIHGGIIATLVDIAGHTALSAKLRHGVPTIDMRIDYLRMATGRELRATAELLKVGRTLGLVEVRITDDAQRLIAVGRAVFSTLDR